MENVAVLKKMTLFHNLDSLELIQVSKLLKHSFFKKGELVVREGEDGHSLFVIKSGTFHAYHDEDGVKKALATFEPNAIFGELAMIDGGPRSANVAALSDGELLEFDNDAFQTLLGYSESLRIKLYRNLTADLSLKLRRTNDKLILLL